MSEELVIAMQEAFREGGDLPTQLRKLAHLVESGTVNGRISQVSLFTNRFPGVNITIEVRPKP